MTTLINHIFISIPMIFLGIYIAVYIRHIKSQRFALIDRELIEHVQTIWRLGHERNEISLWAKISAMLIAFSVAHPSKDMADDLRLLSDIALSYSGVTVK